MVECIKVKIRHQLCFYIINSFAESLDKLIKVFFIKKDLMTIIPVIIESLATFGDSQVIIITTGCSYVKEISPAFTSTNSFAVNAFHFVFVVILVRHRQLVFTD